MRATVLLLALLGAALVLFSGAALAQEESLPDLTVDKTGPSTATPDERITYFIDVTNVGSGDAVLPSGAILVRDDLRIASGKWKEAGFGGGFTVGVTGIPYFIAQEAPVPHNERISTTRLAWEWVNYSEFAADAIISPGGGLSQGSVSVVTFASGDHTINCATVDPDNVIVESDESNNTDCVTTKILP
jgi:hypothetical protein